ncbi:MAG: hypothetical protein ABEI07_00305, partial [Candidatus Nanohaloarchaea archaeon]
MKPEVTFLTSSELQKVLGNSLSEEEEEELRRFRDNVLDFFRGYREALGELENLYGGEWRVFDVNVYVFDGNRPSISSPILLRKDSVETTVFDAFWMLSKNLIRGDPADSEMVESGHAKIESVSLALTVEALDSVMDEKVFEDVVEASKSEATEIKTLRKADE